MSKNVAVKPINEVNPSRLMNIILLTDRFLSRFAKAVCTLTRYSEFQRYHPHPQPARTIAGEYERDGESVMVKPTSRHHQQNYMLKHQPIQQAGTVQGALDEERTESDCVGTGVLGEEGLVDDSRDVEERVPHPQQDALVAGALHFLSSN